MDKLQNLIVDPINWQALREDVRSFIETIRSELESRDYSHFFADFQNSDRIDLSYLENKNKMNDGLDQHPLLLWILKKRASLR